VLVWTRGRRDQRVIGWLSTGLRYFVERDDGRLWRTGRRAKRTAFDR